MNNQNNQNNQNDRERQFTAAAHDPHDVRHHGAITTPLYQTSLFSFANYEDFERAFEDLQGNHVYSRGNNPTVSFLEGKLAELEGAESAKCFASGMAAITAAIMSSVGSGDHVVCVDQAYGPTRDFLANYLKRFAIETTFVDGKSLEAIAQAFRPETKLLYLESPTSQMIELQDLAACAKLAREKDAITIIDGTWATPIFQQPLQLGIDLVVHSITKYISGHSDCLGGVVLGSKLLVDRISNSEYMLFGGIMTPHTASLVTRGLRTLPLRMQRHQENGLRVAEYLSEQAYADQINHPGLASYPQQELARKQMSGYSSLFSFTSPEPAEKMKQWANRLQYFKIGVSWGGFESLVTVGVSQGVDGEGAHTTVRLYVGLESPEDLMRDMEQAWASVSELSGSALL